MDTPQMEKDIFFMREALAQAELGEGGTRPNPPVGAVVVKDGEIIGKGYHQFSGGPHAEVNAIKNCAAPTRGATLYVTLEPCSTQGRVGPCTTAIREAGISRVVVAALDDNPRHKGRGIDILRHAGLEVETGVLESAARKMLAPFFKHISTAMPYVTLKMAQSLDGAIADHAGVAKWVSGEESRAYVAKMRRTADVVLVGAGTALVDNPSLLRKEVPPSFRGLPGYRCVVDATGRLPTNLNIFSDGNQALTIIATSELCPDERVAQWQDAGATVWTLPLEFCPAACKSPRLDMRALLQRMGEDGFMHVLCEGGATLSSTMLAQSLVDKLMLFIAPKVLGAGSLRTFGAIPFDLPTAPRFRIDDVLRFGRDIALEMTPEERN